MLTVTQGNDADQGGSDVGRTTIDLFGPVRVTGARGGDATPKLAKARAILVCLALAPEGRMSRAALRARLWEGRGAEQQAASLRQALSHLRAALGPDRDVLVADAATVALDLGAVELRRPPEEAPGDLATDLDPHEPAFRAWLEAQRGGAARAVEAGPPAMPVVAATGLGGPLADLVATAAMRRVASVLPLRFVPDGAADGADVVLRVIEAGGQLAGARLDGGDGMPLATVTLASGQDARTATDAIAREMLRLPRMGMGDVLCFDPARLAAAEARLAGQAGAPAMALRAFLRNTRIVERMSQDPAEELLEARALSLDALDLEPDNPFALAVASHVAVRQGRIASADAMARRAVHLAPDSAFAQLAFGVVASATGRRGAALTAAGRARRMAGAMVAPAFGVMFHALAAARLGRAEEARDHALAAHDLARDFRPPLRYLAVLQARLGAPEAAAEALALLRRLEPDVTRERLFDPDYPMASLRDGGLLTP